MPTDSLVEKAWWVQGLTTCRGVAVVAKERVGFVPTERPKNLAVEFAWGATGFVEVGAKKLDPERVIAELEAAPSLLSRLGELAESLAGVVWTPDDAHPCERKIPLRRKRRGLWLVSGTQSIRLSRALTVDEISARRELLSAWTWSE